MKYSIPVNKIEKLEKIIKRANKKGAHITFELGDKVVEDGTLYVNDPINHKQYHEPIKVNCVEVFVDGQYKINDWSFLGTIEFTPNGNIIRLADSSFEGKVPAKYLNTPKVCEHCGKIRNRKDTYLIYNDKTDEYKQVGSTCLLDYTKGLDADTCASIMSSLDRILDLANYDCDAETFYGNGYDSTGYGMNRDDILPTVYAYVKQYGYQKMYQGQGTAQDVLMMKWGGLQDPELQQRYESLVMPTDEELEAIDSYAKANKDSEMGYLRNASLAWLNNSVEYRDLSLVCSFVNTYLKDMAKQEKMKKDAESKNNTWVGDIGDRISINVASARCLYTKDNRYKSYYAPDSYMMEIIDVAGHTYIWSSSTNNINAGDIIVATVKSHNEYRGIKQTVITRGKIARINV